MPINIRWLHHDIKFLPSVHKRKERTQTYKSDSQSHHSNMKASVFQKQYILFSHVSRIYDKVLRQ
jgi:hypothetical protein